MSLLADSMAFPFGAQDIFRALRGEKVVVGGLPTLSHITASPPVPPFTTMERTVHAIGCMKKVLLESGSGVSFVKTKRDLEMFGTSERNVVLGLQCAPEDADVAKLASLDIRFLALAYSEKTRWGGGFGEQCAGLTKDGKWLIEECGKHGVIVDISHANHQTARDTLDFIEREKLEVSVAATHGGCWGVYQHLRNLPDNVLRGVAELGGIVGIATITFMLDAKDNSLKPFLTHLVHAVNSCGEGSVCIGTDGVYCNITMEKAREAYDTLVQLVVGNRKSEFNERFPDRPEILIEKGENQLGIISDEINREWPALPIPKLIGMNFFNFLMRALPS